MGRALDNLKTQGRAVRVARGRWISAERAGQGARDGDSDGGEATGVAVAEDPPSHDAAGDDSAADAVTF